MYQSKRQNGIVSYEILIEAVGKGKQTQACRVS